MTSLDISEMLFGKKEVEKIAAPVTGTSSAMYTDNLLYSYIYMGDTHQAIKILYSLSSTVSISLAIGSGW